MKTPKTEHQVARKHGRLMLWALLIAFGIELLLIAGAVGLAYLILS